MRRLLPAVALVLTLPSMVAAAPCVPAALSDYLVLVGGCQVGSATFSNFTSGNSPAPGGPVKIDDDNVQITPGALADGAQLTFSLDERADSFDLLGILIGFSVAGAGFEFNAATLALSGADVMGDGNVTVGEELIPGGTLAVAQIDGLSTSPDARGLPPMLLFQVLVDITLDPFGGTAVLNGDVTTQFTGAPAAPVVPEPASLVLLGTGLLATAARFRRRRSPPVHP